MQTSCHSSFRVKHRSRDSIHYGTMKHLKVLWSYVMAVMFDSCAVITVVLNLYLAVSRDALAPLRASLETEQYFCQSMYSNVTPLCAK